MLLSKKIKRNRLSSQLPYGIATAFLLFVSWPPHGFPILLFVSFVPLLILGSHSETKTSNYFVVLFVTFLLIHILSAGWMYSSTFVGTLLTHLFQALLMSLAFLSWKTGTKWIPSYKFVFFLSGWLSVEYLQTRWAPAWPWFSLGNGFADQTKWIQWYAYTGVLGGSLWILTINWLVFKIISIGLTSNWSKYSAFILTGISSVLIPILLSFYLFTKDNQVATYPVALIQPNINPRTEKFNGISEYVQINRTLKLIEHKSFDQVKLVVFPETFLTLPVHEDHIFSSVSVQSITTRFAKELPISLFIGSFTQRDSSAALQDAAALIQAKRPFVLYNSALLINGDEQFIYHKMKLLPLVEKQLFVSLLKPLRTFIEQSGAIFGSYGTFNETNDYTLNDGTKVTPIICFESVFGEYTARNVKKNNSDFIMLITNDGWWDSDGGYLQHLAYAKLRCIETNRWMVRCANTGVSAIIDNHGTIRQQTRYDEATVLYGMVGSSHDNNTYYSIHGDLIGRYSLIIFAMGLIYKIIGWDWLNKTRK